MSERLHDQTSSEDPADPTRGAHTQTVVRWPAERFYWAVLDAPGVPVSSLRPAAAADALDVLLADEIPLPIDHVHAVYRSVSPGRVLACVAARDTLGTLHADTLALSPRSWPPHLADICGAGAPEEINLLVGDFEPRPIRRARVARAAWAAGFLLLLAGLAALGLLRRTVAWEADAAAALDASRRAMLAALPDEPPGSKVLPIRFKAELEQLRRMRRGTVDADAPRDAAESLAALLAGWPQERLAQAEVVSATPETLSMNIRVDGEPQAVLDAIGAVPGWVRDEPRVARSGRGVLVTLSYRPESAP